jgi:fibronectin-binding autotransporter adhesin
VDNGTLIFKRSNILTNTGSISGNGTVVVGGGGTVILTGNNTWVGGTSISNGTTLQIANGGAGSIALNSPIINNGMLIFNSSTPITVRGGNAIISGTGNIEDKGSGLVMCVGLNTYTGWVQIDAGATFQPFIGNEGALVASAITNNGTLKLVAQDSAPPTRSYAGNIVGTGRVWKDDNNQNPGEVALLGTNTYTGGTLISGGGIVLGDGTNLGSITGNVTFTNTAVDDTASRSLQFDRPDVYTFAGNIIGAALTNGSPNQGNLGRVVQLGTGVVILTGNNTYPGGTLISNGVVQVGNGGTTGSIGGPAGVNLNEPSGNCGIVFDRSNNVLFSNNIAGNGRVVQFGSGILTLSNYMPNIGPMTVSNGTLVISGSQLLGGALNVSGGTIVAGGLSQISTLTVSNNMTISSGTVFAEINKSQGQSNTLYNVLGSSSATGGAILVSNLGPSIVAGDQYFLFSGAVSGGGALSVTGGGVTWSNNTANDGSIIALTSGSGGVIPTVKARITSMSISGANVVLNGTNGVNNGIYYLLDTTDVAQPIGQWIAVATNIVSTNGSATSGFTFTGTNVVTPNAGKQFYILSNTNNH